MKTLFAPAFAVLASTAGTAWGCHVVGMPVTDVKLAAALAFLVSFIAAFGAVCLTGRSRRRRADPAT